MYHSCLLFSNIFITVGKQNERDKVLNYRFVNYSMNYITKKSLFSGIIKFVFLDESMLASKVLHFLVSSHSVKTIKIAH